MLVSSRDVRIRSLATLMLDLVQVNYAAVRRRLANVVVAMEKKMATSDQCPMLKCIQDAIVHSLARYRPGLGCG